MNQSEVKAYRWLVEQGYTDITFHSKTTPDFTTANNKAFEVKRVRNGTIYFSPGQAESLRAMTDVVILVFDDSEINNPVAQIPSSEIRTGDYYWDGIHIISPGGFLIRLQVTDEEKDEIQKEAKKLGLSMSAFMRYLANTYRQEGGKHNG